MQSQSYASAKAGAPCLHLASLPVLVISIKRCPVCATPTYKHGAVLVAHAVLAPWGPRLPSPCPVCATPTYKHGAVLVAHAVLAPWGPRFPSPCKGASFLNLSQPPSRPAHLPVHGLRGPVMASTPHSPLCMAPVACTNAAQWPWQLQLLGHGPSCLRNSASV